MVNIVNTAADALVLVLTPNELLDTAKQKQKQNLIHSTRRIIQSLEELSLPKDHKEIILNGLDLFKRFSEKHIGQMEGPVPKAGFVDKMKEMIVPGKIAEGCDPKASQESKMEGAKLRAAILETALKKSTGTDIVQKRIEELQLLIQG